ncbi:MAG: ABC transporter ATP-binding protein [Firmicutes bacterium]|nr:ABC transporter ATP-binding protein [Bacillota bacterium]
MSLIVLEGVTKRYRAAGEEVVALHPVNLSIGQGEFAAVVGPSGSGKSTLLSILGAMNTPTAGRLVVDGIDVYALDEERRADFRREYVGFVFQQLQLIPYLSALENVMLPLVVTGLGKKVQGEMAGQALESVGLGGKALRLPNELSGGEQQRVAIARAIVNEPPVLLADEATGNLDSRTGENVMSVFEDLNSKGLTIVIVTHNQDNCRYAGRILDMADGRLWERAAAGTTARVAHEPRMAC